MIRRDTGLSPVSQHRGSGRVMSVPCPLEGPELCFQGSLHIWLRECDVAWGESCPKNGISDCCCWGKVTQIEFGEGNRSKGKKAGGKGSVLVNSVKIKVFFSNKAAFPRGVMDVLQFCSITNSDNGTRGDLRWFVPV